VLLLALAKCSLRSSILCSSALIVISVAASPGACIPPTKCMFGIDSLSLDEVDALPDRLRRRSRSSSVLEPVYSTGILVGCGV
jgi:hypothetical protein